MRYEYISMTVRRDPDDRFSRTRDDEMEPLGWKRVWADLAEDTTFIVYRREID